MTQVSADFRLGSDGATIATADPGSLTKWDAVAIPAGGTYVYDMTKGYFTPGAAKIATGVTAGTVLSDWSTAFGTATDFFGRFFLFMTAFPLAAPVRPVRARVAGVTKQNVEITTAGVVQINSDASTTVGTGTVPIYLNQWVRVEWHMIMSLTVGQVEAKLFNDPAGTTPSDVITSAANLNTGTPADNIQHGNGQTTANVVPFWLDEIIAGAASYPGPGTPPFSADVPARPIGGRGASW